MSPTTQEDLEATQTDPWVACTSFEELPLGTWLVKVDDEDAPYQVAYVREANKSKVIIVGHYFHFDSADLIAYKAFCA
ncbi:hypothetical protein [Neptuniibacter sp. QD37_11]|uniref:hypothetical protein n=1 Tax=Neptuniibacter sp. QD37_11 TaxID=3398209 RepID=UPI0039F62E18